MKFTVDEIIKYIDMNRLFNQDGREVPFRSQLVEYLKEYKKMKIRNEDDGK